MLGTKRAQVNVYAFAALAVSSKPNTIGVELLHFSPADFRQPLQQYFPLIVGDVVKVHAHPHRLRPHNQTAGRKGRAVPLQLDSDLRPGGQRPFGVHETTQEAHVRSLGMQPNTRPQFNNLGIGYQRIAR
jgi:hypothetical protein